MSQAKTEKKVEPPLNIQKEYVQELNKRRFFVMLSFMGLFGLYQLITLGERLSLYIRNPQKGLLGFVITHAVCAVAFGLNTIIMYFLKRWNRYNYIDIMIFI